MTGDRMDKPLASPTLHFMCGKAGAGKSTLAQALAQEHNAILLCEDVWLARLYPDELASFDDYIKCSRRIKRVVGPLVVDMLKRQSVVLDFPANTIDTRSWFRSIFEGAAVPHTLHHVDSPDQVCLAQIAQRNQERPEGSHEVSEEMFHYITSLFQPPTSAEGFNVRTHGSVQP
jgi:predicted kinase